MATPTSTSAASSPTDATPPSIEPGPTPQVESGLPAVQEIGIIENYAANRFWPRHILVIKDIPVKLYLTRLHREHDNRFSIEPFYSTSEVILPGEVGVMEFVPDRVGEFKIRNIGHSAEADLIVVATAAEAKTRIEERGIQMYALIHDVDGFRMYPETLVVQKDIFVAIHNISLVAEHQVSIESFVDPDALNVKPRERSLFEFTPETEGNYTIRHELHGFTGQLVLSQPNCWQDRDGEA